MSALRLVKQEIVSSSVSSFIIQDCFTENFDIYKISVTDLMTSTFCRLNLRFVNSAGSVISTGSYAFSVAEETTGSTADIKGNTETAGFLNFFGYGLTSSGANSQGSDSWIFNPLQSDTYTFGVSESSSNGNNLVFGKSIGGFKVLTRVTGIQVNQTVISGSNPTIDSGTVSVYGLRIS